MTNREGDNISVLLGTGRRELGAATTYGTGDRATSIVATDLTNDGILDLAVANQYGYSIRSCVGSAMEPSPRRSTSA